MLNQFNGLVVFDVGANVGDWSMMLTSNSKIHAFEILPDTYKLLIRNLGSKDNIFINNVGLSDENGTMEVHLSQHSDVTTAHKLKGVNQHEDYYLKTEKCEVIKAEDYIIQNNIEGIDFLKIDTEGNDFNVLQGFGEKIKLIKAVQFEYGIFNIASRALLYDFYVFFEKYNFKVGRLFPKHIDFSGYNTSLENFHGGNFIALNNDFPTWAEEFENRFILSKL